MSTLATVPVIVSRWKDNEDSVDTQETVRVVADAEVPQVCLEIRGTGLYLTPLQAEIIETAIRVARQSFRRR